MGSSPKEWSALNHFHQKWNDLDGRAREAACLLNYTEEEWNAGRVSHLFLIKKNWNDLDLPQKDAAQLLGLDEHKWNKVAASVDEKHPTGLHDETNEEPTLLPSPFE